jgi:hypothetical protein
LPALVMVVWSVSPRLSACPSPGRHPTAGVWVSDGPAARPGPEARLGGRCWAGWDAGDGRGNHDSLRPCVR